MFATYSWLVLPLLAATAGESSPLTRYQRTQFQMGTSFQIVLYAADEATADAAFGQAFERIAELNALLSDYRADSEVSQLSAASPVRRRVGIDTYRVLARAQEFSRQTGGAFDVTVGPLTKLWRRARRRKQLPAADLLAAAKQATGYGYMRVGDQPGTVELTRGDMRLDLGGIAKGYAADEAIAAMRRHGVTRVLVNAGGDVVAGLPPPGLPGWRVGVAPLDARRPPSQILLLQQGAVATSGDAWQYVELAGKRYSHIVDPHTGLGLTDRSSVTVIAPDGMTADALASAVSVMGIERGMAFIEGVPDVEAIMVVVEDGRARRRATSFGGRAVALDAEEEPSAR